MGYEIPWSLDDLDPETTLDQEIREKVNKAISFFKNRLEKAGYKPKEDKYQELLAASLFVFVMAVKKYLIPEKFKEELEAAKLGEVVEYIKKEGGLSLLLIKNDCELTSSALAALMSKPKCGHCIEQSLVLYAVFKTAGLNVLYVDMKAPPGSDLLKRLGYPPNTYHSSVALVLSNKVRIFDPGLKESDAEEMYKENSVKWKLLNSREFLSISQSNLGAKFQIKEMLDKAIAEYKKAIKTNPKNASAHYNLVAYHVNLGIDYERKGEFDKAIQEYKNALEINPNFLGARHNLGNILITLGKNLINMGKIKEGWNKLKKAKVELEKVLKLNPDSTRTLESIKFIESIQKILRSQYPDLK